MSGAYYRAKRGDTVHQEMCALADPDYRWRYVDGYTPERVLQVIAERDWLRACKLCWPQDAQ